MSDWALGKVAPWGLRRNSTTQTVERWCRRECRMLDDLTNEFQLNEAEKETLRRAAHERDLSLDQSKRSYTKQELLAFGLVREAYTPDEMKALGFGVDVV